MSNGVEHCGAGSAASAASGERPVGRGDDREGYGDENSAGREARESCQVPEAGVVIGHGPSRSGPPPSVARGARSLYH